MEYQTIDYDTWVDYFKPLTIYPDTIEELVEGKIFLDVCPDNLAIIESTKVEYVWTMINEEEIVQGFIPDGLRFAITDRPWYTTTQILVSLGGIH